MVIPSVWVEFLPFAILAAVIFTWNSMTNNQEIIVMKSTGSSNLSLYVSFLIIGGMASLVSLLFVWYIVPNSYIKYFNIRGNLDQSSTLSIIEPGKFTEVNPDLTFYVKSISNTQFKQIIIHTKNANDDLTIFAENGFVQMQDNNLVFLLEQVMLFELDNSNNSKSFIRLDNYLVTLPSGGSTYVGERNTPREFYLHELINYKNLNYINNQADLVKKENQYNAVFKEIVKRLNITLFPFFIILITAYYFATSTFSRLGNNTTIVKIVATVLAAKITTLIVLYSPLNFWISGIINVVIPVILILILYAKVFIDSNNYAKKAVAITRTIK
jgi:lipopolysaccharide export system permease protein